jgi:hypothetical protein
VSDQPRRLVTCPCCHGKRRLTLFEHDEVAGRTVVTHPMCCHCQGEGVVSAEVSAMRSPKRKNSMTERSAAKNRYSIT